MADKNAPIKFLKILFGVSVFLNFLLIFTPEIGFDALWYHLTLPKIFIATGRWYIPGGLLYYSVMPRLSELFFVPLLQLFGTAGPKLLQFAAGIGTTRLIYLIDNHYSFTRLQKWLSICLFYITWIVAWQSGSAYIDLIRTFLETLALLCLLKRKRLLGGIVLGLAIGTKWLSLGSLVIYALIFGLGLVPPALFVALPWFLIAFFYTHNPIYPVFEPFMSHTTPNIFRIFYNLLLAPLRLTFPADDFVSPLVGILFIASIYSFFKYSKIRQIAALGVFGTIYTLVLNPPSSRFLLPYLPALSISAIYLFGKLKLLQQKVSYSIILLSSMLIICLRLYATKKYLPFLFGQVSQNQFLTQYSDRLPGAFIDSDNFVQDSLPGTSSYLIDGLHNLYYFPYAFDHTSWWNQSKTYDYLVSNTTPPDKMKVKLLHTNQLNISVYQIEK